MRTLCIAILSAVTLIGIANASDSSSHQSDSQNITAFDEFMHKGIPAYKQHIRNCKRNPNQTENPQLEEKINSMIDRCCNELSHLEKEPLTPGFGDRVLWAFSTLKGGARSLVFYRLGKVSQGNALDINQTNQQNNNE